MDIPKYIVLLIFAVAAILFVIYIATIIHVFGWEQFEGLEKKLGKTEFEESETTYIRSYLTGTLPEAKQFASAIGNSEFVSEIGCDIAKDIYDDFTTWGEYTRDYIEETRAFYELESSSHIKNLCEYDTTVDESNTAKHYFCSVGVGKFNFSAPSRSLWNAANLNDPTGNVQKLIDGKCCLSSNRPGCGCTRGGGFELKLDEVCVNEFFNNFENPPPGSALPFCTLGSNYIRVGTSREKFGNNGCYHNSNNCILTDEGWDDWCVAPPPNPGRCKTLCDASGVRDDGSPILVQDTDRVSFWGSDQDSSLAIVTDSNMIQNKETLEDSRPYFYIVYWNNSDKRYKIDIPRITPPFPGDQRYYDNSSFHDFLRGLFDNELQDKRNTTAGMWYPELRTVYDGNITLSGTAVPLVTNLFLLDLEKAIGNGIKFHERSCQKGGDCLDYTVNLEVYDRVKQGGDVYVRISSDININQIPSGNYRVVVRNWISELYHTTLTLTEETGNQIIKDARYMDRTIIICKDDCV